MEILSKSLVRAGLVLLAGGALWPAFLHVVSQATPGIPAAGLVILMGLYIIGFASVAFLVHTDTVAGLPFEDAQQHRRPSLVIPTTTTIALMIFIVGYASSNTALWVVA